MRDRSVCAGAAKLLVDGLGIGRDRLHATVFGLDQQAGPYIGSLRTWTVLGVPVS